MFGLAAKILTSGIGVPGFELVLVSLPIPALHWYTSWEIAGDDSNS